MGSTIRWLVLLLLAAPGLFVHAAEQATAEQAIVADLATTRYVISEESEIRILVYRAGLLGGLGHNHIVSTNSISGEIDFGEAPDMSSFEFRFAVTSLVVDDPALRDAEGDDFPGRISEKDVRGTRKNMLGRKLLDAERFSDIAVSSVSVEGDYPHLELVADVTVRGNTNRLQFPATIDFDDERMIVTGEKRVTHKELGLKPFKAGLGTLRVAKEMLMRYRFVAARPD